ncbi:DUF2849 domain-containing protein [Erythrobacter crassostreae]|uniref:DUF2849 domain-containing protein n=1 Tax=Erythrobacter crassostreae TaxID=2828328 RepID=A0A9X1JPE3_9SPHN|nr:DUF2849 domain-containing protein [Erythrobacter crassostrea]MBV7259342.1 DUF2849 domain-containing protein [Erythrobacter crassostrea]
MKILTGNDLKSGAVIWWDGENWSSHVDCALDVGEQGPEILAREEALRRVNVPYIIEAERTEDGVRPAHIKDRVRAVGPTVRPDLTLDPQNTDALDWVI